MKLLGLREKKKKAKDLEVGSEDCSQYLRGKSDKLW